VEFVNLQDAKEEIQRYVYILVILNKMIQAYLNATKQRLKRMFGIA